MSSWRNRRAPSLPDNAAPHLKNMDFNMINRDFSLVIIMISFKILMVSNAGTMIPELRDWIGTRSM